MIVERLGLRSSNRLTPDVTRNHQRNHRTLDKTDIATPSIGLRPCALRLLPPKDRPGPIGYFRWIQHTRHPQREYLLMEGLFQESNSWPFPHQQLPQAPILTEAHGRGA